MCALSGADSHDSLRHPCLSPYLTPRLWRSAQAWARQRRSAGWPSSFFNERDPAVGRVSLESRISERGVSAHSKRHQIHVVDLGRLTLGRLKAEAVDADFVSARANREAAHQGDHHILTQSPDLSVLSQ